MYMFSVKTFINETFLWETIQNETYKKCIINQSEK
jgi:hypothetical protein